MQLTAPTDNTVRVRFLTPSYFVSASSSSPSTLTGKVNQLEVILRQLQHDLRKVGVHPTPASAGHVRGEQAE